MSPVSPVTPFTVGIEESKLHRLHQKLGLTDFPPELDQADSAYGAPLSDVTRLAKYWKDGFDWRTQEAKLNELPQFTTNITVDGFGELNVHFVHQKSDVANAIPLLFIHGFLSKLRSSYLSSREAKTNQLSMSLLHPCQILASPPVSAKIRNMPVRRGV